MRHQRLLVLCVIVLATACIPTPPKASDFGTRGLSAVERDALRELAPVDLVATKVTDVPAAVARFVVAASEGIVTLRVPAQELPAVESALLAANGDGVVALDASVDLARDRRDEPNAPANEQLLFGGKEEFGVAAWSAAHPEGDGRGVRIAVVDDGVAIGRPGLLVTTDGNPKIAGSINISSRWQLPLRAAPLACERPAATAAASAAWDLSAVPELDLTHARYKKSFDLDACGVNPGVVLATDKCFAWGDAFLAPRAALYAEIPDAQRFERAVILVDVNGDGKIAADEVLAPLTRATKADRTAIALGDGRFLGFDVQSSFYTMGVVGPIDDPLASCANSVPERRFLSVSVPEDGWDTGSHGEGVASIAAGHAIAGRSFDGVAPGAAVIDVHLADVHASNRYTIAELARALHAGGNVADVVNLSYSLFFSSAASQVAMGRVLENALASTKALYFFSAGNNGPGRGSMNRALIYPKHSIPVGAYLTPAMAQSTFGSALAYGGVVVYSSRGPGLDGASGPLVMSPLAGIVADTADGGFGPFSGTSSATPAMSGFAARLISQLRKEGLTIDRALLRQAILDGAQPLQNVAFVDQGYGVPKLEAALVLYRALSALTLRTPRLGVSGGVSGQGVTQRGVHVRGEVGRLPRHVFTITPEFDLGWSEAARGNYAEHVTVEAVDPLTGSTPAWLNAPTNLLLSRSGARLDVALDWSAIAALDSSEALAELRIRNADTGALRHVLPVTIARPHAATAATISGELTLGAGETSRIFVTRPAWATHLLVSTEARDGSEICGILTTFDPNGRRAAPVGTSLSTDGTSRLFVRDGAYAADKIGTYELTFVGASSHNICPQTQELGYRLQWFGLATTVLSSEFMVHDDTHVTASVSLQLQTEMNATSGSLFVGRPGLETTIELVREGLGWEWRTAAPVDFTSLGAGGKISLRFDADFIAAQAAVSAYPYWNLRASSVATPNQWTFLDLSPIGDPVESSVPATFGPTDLQLAAFDLGAAASTSTVLPSRLRIVARGEPAGAAGINATARQIQLRHDAAAVVNLDLTGETQHLDGRVLACEFRPARFDVTLPCGTIELPQAP